MTLSGPRSPKFPLTLRASSRFASTDTFEDGEELEEDAYDNNASTPYAQSSTPVSVTSNDNDPSHTESVSAWHTAKFLVFFPDRLVHNPHSIPSRYGEIKPPGSSRYGSLGTIGRSPLGGSSHPFDSSSGNGNNGNGYRHNTIDASNMSPFVRDVGQILLDNGSALRELSDAFLCLWTWPGNEDDDEGPSNRLTTSRTTTLT
ncbi:hypothetical protein EDD15DRAFT_2534026 [Pisolithus albus]|nr:hypothetical protein EDD15DRAFT_2534026 [Pisolithus albus]